MFTFKKIFDRSLGYLPFTICFILLYLSETFNSITSANGITQLILFTIVVQSCTRYVSPSIGERGKASLRNVACTLFLLVST